MLGQIVAAGSSCASALMRWKRRNRCNCLQKQSVQIVFNCIPRYGHAPDAGLSCTLKKTMDNTTRSERSRSIIIQAALTIISRDGPGRLTLDAIAREAGISKGGLTHQFPNKEAVLRALLEHQCIHFEQVAKDYMQQHGANSSEANLATNIEVARAALSQPQSVAFAILGAIGENPSLLSIPRDLDVKHLEAIKAEAADPELATLRWAASRGLLLTSLFGVSPISDAERDKLFERLLDSSQWNLPAAKNTPS